MRQVGNRAHFLHASLERLGAFQQQAAMPLFNSCAFPLYHFQIDLDAGQVLSQAIVQLPADVAALIILQAYQTRRQGYLGLGSAAMQTGWRCTRTPHSVHYSLILFAAGLQNCGRMLNPTKRITAHGCAASLLE